MNHRTTCLVSHRTTCLVNHRATCLVRGTCFMWALCLRRTFYHVLMWCRFTDYFFHRAEGHQSEFQQKVTHLMTFFSNLFPSSNLSPESNLFQHIELFSCIYDLLRDTCFRPVALFAWPVTFFNLFVQTDSDDDLFYDLSLDLFHDLN